jgi:chromosome segregation ATPase
MSGGATLVQTPEERIAALEQGLLSLGEGIRRVETTLEKLDISVSSLVEKLDARYPSKETVDLRFEDVHKELALLRKDHDALDRRVQKMQAWMYKAAGAIAIVAFGIGVLANSHKW